MLKNKLLCMSAISAQKAAAPAYYAELIRSRLFAFFCTPFFPIVCTAQNGQTKIQKGHSVSVTVYVCKHNMYRAMTY